MPKVTEKIKPPKISQEDLMKALDVFYNASANGIPLVSEPVEKMASDYLSKHKTVESAAKAMLRNQIIKCTTSGTITGFGGFITFPVAIPANLSSVLYVQVRAVACTAYMGGYDLNSDQLQTFVYACIAGVSVTEIGKKFGIKFGEKLTTNAIKKIPGSVVRKINQYIGFRFLTKFGEKGLVNLGKMVPAVGALINGGFDFVETRAVANRAYKMFIENKIDIIPSSESESEPL